MGEADGQGFAPALGGFHMKDSVEDEHVGSHNKCKRDDDETNAHHEDHHFIDEASQTMEFSRQEY